MRTLSKDEETAHFSSITIQSRPNVVTLPGSCRVFGRFYWLDQDHSKGSMMLIQKLRLQRGWSQEQLSDISGLSSRTIQRLERGQPASLETLKTLAAVFEIDLKQLQEPIMDTDAPPPPVSHKRDHAERLAFAHVRKMRGFYWHLSQYILVISLLFIVNLATYRHFIWAIFPALGWGLGLTIHGLSVWSRSPLLNAEWERREVEKYLGRKL